MKLDKRLVIAGCFLFTMACGKSNSNDEITVSDPIQLDVVSNRIGHWTIPTPIGTEQKTFRNVSDDGYLIQTLNALSIKDRSGNDISFEMIAKEIDCEDYDRQLSDPSLLDYQFKSSIGFQELNSNNRSRYVLRTAYKDSNECLSINFISQDSSETGIEAKFDNLKKILALRSTVTYTKDRFGFNDWSLSETSKISEFFIDGLENDRLMIEKMEDNGFYFLNPKSKIKPGFLLRERDCSDADLNVYTDTNLEILSKAVSVRTYIDDLTDDSSRAYRINYLFSWNDSCVTLMISTSKSQVNALTEAERIEYLEASEKLAGSFSVVSESSSLSVR
ncbi:hypothetical protein [Pseudobacteriovorax antillogorgiicola]|uniref:Uncharacterized protein n=1 Tax=Pseudobacteriovorax antillogorgiicola TaxID=1513793 RepID=A0A1Y6BBY8_9BACT|nr:hypothetical protein [Pseudobacteriovorax antillogorgiicola]TCS58748.1 hypothetical protein EDD56_102262 [Pseudobacteriovorax antillogorgiicola]SME95182.1 hypothetical protein SAMN06296036_102181 [Pseudobacteriovorax antillogorgiicola]